MGTSNYDKMTKDANARFLTFDQEVILARWPLQHDEDYFYLNFVGRPYTVDRHTGVVAREGKAAGFDETLSILDMICNSRHAPACTGQWTTLTKLTNAAGVGPASMEMLRSRLEGFAGRMEDLAQACEALGGIPCKGGDVSFLFPVFDSFPLWFQCWDADEEFPLTISFLWDSTTPDHLHYETLWYIMGFILDRLRERA